MIIVLSPAYAQAASETMSGPMTIQEFTNRQADIKRAEMESKLEEARRKGNPSSQASPPVTGPVARTCDDDLSMYAVYGIARNLRADFGYRGATITAAAGDHVDMGGWSVEELTATRALMVKRTGKKVIRCPLYLSAGVREFAAPLPSPQPRTPSVPESSVEVPPIFPVSGAAVGSTK
jgi:hypothetical protein